MIVPWKEQHVPEQILANKGLHRSRLTPQHFVLDPVAKCDPEQHLEDQLQ